MTRSVVAALALVCIAAPAHAADPVPKTAGKAVVLLVTKIDRYDASLTITVNDLPIVKTAMFEYPRGGGDPYIRIPAFLLHKGTNTVHIAYAERNPKPAHDFDVSLAELATYEPQKAKQVLFHVAPAISNLAEHPFAGDYAFEVTSDLPRPSFETSKVIADDAKTAAKLKAAAVALSRRWAKDKRVTGLFADQLRNGPDENVTNLGRWVAHPKLTLDLRDEEATMQVFASGHLARLVWDNILPWRFVGGAHDAPRGQMGPVDIEMDVWFRVDDKGAFVPVAVWQTGVAPDRL